jgi:biopolymer transport protein ExbB
MTVLIFLALCSLIAVAFIIERLWIYRKAMKVSVNELLLLLKDNLSSSRKLGEAANICRQVDNPASRVFLSGLNALKSGKSKVEEAMEKQAAAEMANLEKRLVTLGTLGNVSPFIGLLGTVIGVIDAFMSIAGSSSGTGSFDVVGSGIAQALVSTAFGLFVAILAVVSYNYFNSIVSKMAARIEAGGNELMGLLGISKEK